jgi:hypothetical protein
MILAGFADHIPTEHDVQVRKEHDGLRGQGLASWAPGLALTWVRQRQFSP